MLDQLKRYVAVVVGVLLTGIAWMERVDESSAEAGIQAVLPRIEPACLQVIPDDRPALTLRDAFRVDVVYRRPQPEDDESAPVTPEEPLAPVDPGFVLQIQSVVAFGNGAGQARINGFTVKVGAPIPGTFPHDPPVLLALMGTSALILYQGEHLLLDVDRIPSLRVGGPPTDQGRGSPEGPSGELP